VLENKYYVHKRLICKVHDVEHEGGRGRRDRKFRVLRIRLVLTSTSRRSLSHSALHYAEI